MRVEPHKQQLRSPVTSDCTHAIRYCHRTDLGSLHGHESVHVFGEDDLLVSKSLAEDLKGLLVVGRREGESSNSIRSCAVKDGPEVVEFINFRLRWMAALYVSQNEVHLTGFPLNWGREILGRFTLATEDVGSGGSTGGSVTDGSMGGGSVLGRSVAAGGSGVGVARPEGLVKLRQWSSRDRAAYIRSFISSA